MVIFAIQRHAMDIKITKVCVCVCARLRWCFINDSTLLRSLTVIYSQLNVNATKTQNRWSAMWVGGSYWRCTPKHVSANRDRLWREAEPIIPLARYTLRFALLEGFFLFENLFAPVATWFDGFRREWRSAYAASNAIFFRNVYPKMLDFFS